MGAIAMKKPWISFGANCCHYRSSTFEGNRVQPIQEINTGPRRRVGMLRQVASVVGPITTLRPQMTTSTNASFCKSVLRIEVPVTVTLARKQMPIDSVLHLVPGAIIHFDKPFDSPMTVEVDDQPLATGEIVKTGDKFGIRISTILEPRESFKAVSAS